MNRGLVRTLLIVSAVLQVPYVGFALAEFRQTPLPPLVGAVVLAVLALIASGLGRSWTLLVTIGVAVAFVGRLFSLTLGGYSYEMGPLSTLSCTSGFGSSEGFCYYVPYDFLGREGLPQLLATAGLIVALVAVALGWTVGVKDKAPRVAVVSALPVAAEDGSVAAGWYADPDGRLEERYWDGSAWQQSRPMTAATLAQRQAVAGGRAAVDADGNAVSPKSRAAAALLCFFLGVLGIHRFYVGKVGTGIAQIFTLGGLGVWALVDFIMILVGSFRDKSGQRLVNW
jgi:hypothetical protein